MDVQKILGVSITTAERTAVSAAYDGSVLVIGRLEPLEGNLLTWRKRAITRVQEAVSEGTAVFVEELGDIVAQHAHGVLFSDMHPLDNRPILSVALDWYFSMLHAGAIVFAPGTERARIMESAVDMSNDDRGRNVYRVDWTRVKGGHRAVLLCCLAAEGLQPISDGYIDQLYQHLPDPQSRVANPLDRVRAVLGEWDIERERQMQALERSRK